MKDKSKILKFQIYSFIVVCILGTLLHFTYDWSNQNTLVAAFSAVNESTWEHLKLAFFPMLFSIVVGYFYIGKDIPNYICAKTKAILVAISFIIIFFYTYTGVIGKNIDIINIRKFFCRHISRRICCI